MTDVLKMVQSYLLELKGYEGVDPLEVLSQQAGIPAERVIRLNGNENLYGPSPRVREALTSFGEYNLYPDPHQRRIREALASYVGVEVEQVVAGSGSDELIDLTLRLFFGPGDRVIQPTPTFGMYSFSARAYGGDVISVERDDRFEVDVERIQATIDSRTRMVFVASPNNPTGNVTSESTMRALLNLGLPVVVDETYHEFCGHTVVPLLKEYANLIVLRSFSKWAGLAGLRVGYGIMVPELAQVVLRMKPPYNVNRAAEVAVIASLEDVELLSQRVKEIVSERERMYSLLQCIPGIQPWPSQANFILCRVPEGCGRPVAQGLARRGIFVRYFDTPRLRDFVRISVGLRHHTDSLVQALEEVVKECIQ